MVDKPRLTPQAFAKGGSQGAPRLSAQTPNFRAAPSVTAFADASIADTLVGMADDAKRLEMLSSNQFGASMQQFQNAQAEIEEDQRVEQEAIFAETGFAVDAAIAKVRETASVNDVPSASMQAYDDIVQKALSRQDLSAYQKKLLQENFDKGRVAIAGESLKYQTNLRQVERQNNEKKIISSYGMQVFNNPARLPDILEMAQDKLSPAAYESAKIFVTQSSMKGMAQTSEGAQQLSFSLQNGVYDDVLSVDEKSSYLKMAQQKVKVNGNKLSFEQMVEKGQFLAKMEVDPHSITQENMRDAVVKFNLTGGRITEFYKNHERAKLKKEQDDNTIGRVFAAANGDFLLRPTNKSDVNAVDLTYEKSIMKQVAPLYESGRSDEANDILTSFVADTGIVPTALKQDLVSRIRSNNPEQVTLASDLVSRIQEKTGGDNSRIDIMSDEDLAYLDRYEQIVKYADSPEEALRIQAQEENQPFQEQRRKQFVDTWDNKKALEVVAKVLDKEGEDLFVFGKARIDNFTDTQDKILANMQSAGLTRYIINPDDDKLYQRSAQAAIKNMSARKEADGSDRIMEYAPEKFYYGAKTPDQVKSIGTLINDDLREIVHETYPDLENNRFTIQADQITIRELTDQDSTPPSYAIIIDHPDFGMMNLQEDGLQVRMVMPELKQQQERQLSVKELKQQAIDSVSPIDKLLTLGGT